MKFRLLLVAFVAPLLMGAQTQAVLTVTVGPAGETVTEVTVDGAGFRPNRPVEVRFVGTAGNAASVTADVDSDGVFTVTTSLTRNRGYAVQGWQQQGNHLVSKAQTQIFVP